MSDSFVTSWTVAHQAPLCTGFSRQEYWSGLQVLLSPGIFLTQRLNPLLLHWQAYFFFFYHWTTLEAQIFQHCILLFLLFFISCITLPTFYSIFEIIFQINYLHRSHCVRFYSCRIQTQKAENVLFVTVFLILF